LVAVAEIVALAFWYAIDPSRLDATRWLPSAVITVSVFVASSLAVGLVSLAVLAIRNRNVRRTVAVLWDIATFWPRANHPLTPPSYGGRTVYELLVRLQTLHSEADTRVVFAAHSQGSIIAAATLLHDNGEARERIALLTFGSPLRRLYARNFPAYFGDEALRRLRERQPSAWINLWAHSDPIGGWVTDTSETFTNRRGNNESPPEILAALKSVDIRLLDVEGDMRMRPDGSYRPICGHSGFWVRPEYNAAMTTLGDQLTPQGSATDTSATAPPTEKAL
jgi:pimeloyl-ACP methyl ester carboxylesterase